MRLLTVKTELEMDVLKKDASVLRCIEAIHNTVTVLKEENEKVRSLPTDRLLAVLNHDIDANLSIIESNTAVGILLNGFLDRIDLPKFPNRTITSSEFNGIVFNGVNFEPLDSSKSLMEPLTPNP